MRASFIGLLFAVSLTAQTKVPMEQCLGGTLTAIQAQSITLKFNDQIQNLPIAPGVEIWRRGMDLETASISL